MEPVESLEGGRRGGMALREGRVELAHGVPLFRDQAEVNGAPPAFQHGVQRPVIAGGVGAIDILAMEVLDPWAEAQAGHGKGGEVDLGIAVGVGVVFGQVRGHFHESECHQ